MKETNYKIEGKTISYLIEPNGYSIYLDNQLWMEQHDDCSKLFKSDGTYEENCIMQIEDIVASFENSKSKRDEVSEIKAQIEYIAMMSDVDLTEIAGGEE